MRTTVNIHDDVLEKLRDRAEKDKLPFKYVLNEAIRRGLECREKEESRKQYRTEPRNMGLKQGYSLDNVQELLSRIEGEDVR